MKTPSASAALSNRRGFILLSQHAFGLCKRHKDQASMIYLNLEDRKTAAAFAQLLGGNFRASDVVGQLAENEFAVFLSHADQVSADISLRRFANLVADYNESSGGQSPLTYRADIERVDFNHHQSIDDLLRRPAL
ncbi:GGDEF domain-containing protein [Exilibacterium tricleocarpae]|nr:diguanylate cyclase [Exilibacterium tricleocarpae]